MFRGPSRKTGWLTPMTLVLLLVAACAPAAPSPTAAPTKPAEKPAVAAPTAAPAPTTAPAPTAAPAPKPTEAAKPAEKPAEKPAAGGPSFYEGKTLRFIVGLAAGGGYDTYTRAIARHFSKHVPGNPNNTVENMVGAAGLVAANHVYKVAPQDGTVIHMFVGGLAYSELNGMQGIEFESTRFQWLGAPVPDTYACMVRKETGLKSLVEVRGRQQPLILGGTGPGGATDDVPKVLRAALDLNLKVTSGYGGTSQVRLAMDRGEVDGACYSWESMRATSLDRVKAGDLVVIGHVAEKEVSDLPGVPRFLEMAQNDEAKLLIQQGLVARSKIERPFLVGPGVPPERVAILRDALMKTLNDPAFLEDARKANLDVEAVSGEEVTQIVRGIFALPDNVKAKLKATLTAE